MSRFIKETQAYWRPTLVFYFWPNMLVSQIESILLADIVAPDVQRIDGIMALSFENNDHMATVTIDKAGKWTAALQAHGKTATVVGSPQHISEICRFFGAYMVKPASQGSEPIGL